MSVCFAQRSTYRPEDPQGAGHLRGAADAPGPVAANLSEICKVRLVRLSQRHFGAHVSDLSECLYVLRLKSLRKQEIWNDYTCVDGNFTLEDVQFADHYSPCIFSVFYLSAPPPPFLFFFNGRWRRLSMNGRALSLLGPMTQLQGEHLKALLIDQINHGSPTGDRQEEVRCIIGF